MTERVLYIGTTDGLYQGEANGSGLHARLLGFKGEGPMRATVAVDVDDPRRLYAGTTRVGMFRSDDAGATWAEINDGIVYKDVWSIVQHPRTRMLYAGTCPSNVFKSADGGDTWQECKHLSTLPTTKGWTGPVPPHVSRLKSLSLCAQDPNAIYGAIEEGWAIRSLDGGQTWDQIAEGMDHDGHTIAVMPDDPNTVVATGGKGAYRSVDRGTTWTLSNDGIEDCHYTPAHLIVHSARPQVLLTAVSAVGPGGWSRPEGPGVRFVRSENQGRSWDVMQEGLPGDYHGVPRALAGDSEDLDLYYAGMTDGTVWMSQDGGDSFHQILGGLPPVLSIRVAHQ